MKNSDDGPRANQLRLLPAGNGCRVGLAPTGKRRLVTAHAHLGHEFASTDPPLHFRCSRSTSALSEKFLGFEVSGPAGVAAALETFSNPGRVKPPHCSTRMHERARGLWFLKFNLMVSADCQPTSASLLRPMFLLEVLMEKRASHAAASDVHRTAPNATAKPGVAIANARRLTLGEQNVENTEDCIAPTQPPRFPRIGHSGLGSRGSCYLSGHFSRRAT